MCEMKADCVQSMTHFSVEDGVSAVHMTTVIEMDFGFHLEEGFYSGHTGFDKVSTEIITPTSGQHSFFFFWTVSETRAPFFHFWQTSLGTTRGQDCLQLTSVPPQTRASRTKNPIQKRSWK